jgi:hypothetical protein
MPEPCLSSQLGVRRCRRHATFRCSARHGYHGTDWHLKMTSLAALCDDLRGQGNSHCRAVLAMEPANFAEFLRREAMRRGTRALTKMCGEILRRSVSCFKPKASSLGVALPDAAGPSVGADGDLAHAA